MPAVVGRFAFYFYTILCVVVTLSLLSCLSCTNPKYAPPSQTTNDTLEQKLSRCRAKFASAHCVAYAWEKMPTDADYGSFLFRTFLPSLSGDAPVPEDPKGTVAVVLWMPSMGHGSSPVTVEHLDVGTYRASDVFFTMKGDWEIRFQVKDGGNVQDQAIIPITL
ncbi:MAG: FixH family protein [Bdellovibrionales bacterium]